MILPRWADAYVRRFLEGRGYVFVRNADNRGALARRKRILTTHCVDLVVDVGANAGQYGLAMRGLGYAGRIFSFEPMRSAWAQLERTMSRDSFWDGAPVGLADAPGMLLLHVAGNSISSSLLPMLPRHMDNAPGSGYVGDETVRMSTLDEEFPKIRGSAVHIWLKLDVQGYEFKVLLGAVRTLPLVSVIQAELSLATLYKGQETYLPFCQRLDALGFDLVGVEPGFQDGINGNLLQIDGIFQRR